MSAMAAAEAALLDALPHPMLEVCDGVVRYCNGAAETFFSVSSAALRGRPLHEIVPFATPLLDLVDAVARHGAPTSEYRVDLSSPRTGTGVLVDVYGAPIPDRDGAVALMIQRRSMAEKIDRQLTHRSAARSVTGLAAMLAHEIKNPLAGIRGAAQLLEAGAADEDDRRLTRLIQSETDRIVRLVDRMHQFADDRPVPRTALNIHLVLEHVREVLASGEGRGVELAEDYDPSLPPVFANRDQLVQVFMNLAKNACEAVAEVAHPRVTFRTAFRPGLRLARASGGRVSLPLEFCVEDNGPGAPSEIAGEMFEPFVTTRAAGSGLGLALVAKVVGDHGGIVEHERADGVTRFRVLMPAFEPDVAP